MTICELVTVTASLTGPQAAVACVCVAAGAWLSGLIIKSVFP